MSKRPPSDDAAAFRRAAAVREKWVKRERIPGIKHGSNRAIVSPSRPSRVLQMLSDQGGLCSICSKPITEVYAVGFPAIYRVATIDHIVPVSRGGTNCRTNLRVVHWLCNQKRGNKHDPAEAARCFDCGTTYEAFALDATLPDEDWASISPTGGSSGILCANCMVRRVYLRIPGAVAVRMVIAREPGATPEEKD